MSNATYYYCAFATNSKGTSTGDVLSFKTAQELSLPTVQTNAATDISASSGTLNGNVTSDGNTTITQRGFYWSETDNTPDSGDNKEIVSGSTGTYSKTISSLQANTTYYYCAFAINSKGTATGGVLSFKTPEEQGNESGTFTDTRDGNTYKWVKIGEQIWMAENLAYLPEVSPPSEESTSEPLFYVYDYFGTNVSMAKDNDYYTICGVLYNWSAAIEVCPDGWHLPGDEVALYIDNFKGPFYKAENGTWSQIGHFLKSNSNWDEFIFGDFQGQNGTNEFGFSVLPNAYVQGGVFSDYGGGCQFWTATELGQFNSAWKRNVHFHYKELGHYYASFSYGASVRCIKN